MHRTIFDTPISKDMLRLVAILYLRFMGWQAEGEAPKAQKFVLIAAPHTSNWDVAFMIAVVSVLRINIYWLGKRSLFFGPLGPVLMWFGGVPVDRARPSATMVQVIKSIRSADEIALAIAPEGTRKKVRSWKRGFYAVASGAKVPIALGYLDYGRKVGGIGPLFEPTGDYDADLEKIKDYYSSIQGKYPTMSVVPATQD